MSIPARKALVALTVVAAGFASLAGPAFADTTTPTTTTPTSSTPTSSTAPTPTSRQAAALAALKAKANVAIDARLASLHFAVSDVSTNPVISASDKQTLLADLNGDLSGLTALQAKIAADTTLPTAKADYADIFGQYRVYALMLPQVMFAAAADDITGGALPALLDAQTKLAYLLGGPDKNADTPTVQAAMKDLAAQIQGIGSATNGLSGTVLAFTPADWDANHSILSAPRSALSTAQVDLKTARADVAFVVKQVAS
jgi:hypothetical protein